MKLIETGSNTGKVSKQHLILTIMQEEQAAGRDPLDHERILLIASKRLEGLDPKITEGVTINKSDYDNARALLRGDPTRVGKSHPNNGRTPTPKVAPPPAIKYGASELIAAKVFLHACGNSLTVAHSLLDLVSRLTKKE